MRDGNMRKGIIAVLAVVSALASGAARDADAADVERSAAANALLKAELADSRKRIERLEKRVADLTAAVERLEKALANYAPGGAELPKAAKAPTKPPKRAAAGKKLSIRVSPGGWGDASARDIQKVLLSAGGELWRFFPDRKLAPIVVRHSSSGPISLYQRGPGGEYTIKLDVEGRHWAQFAYQFAHEFCHVLSNYSAKSGREHRWFDETLCETASAFAIRRMAVTWKTSPPYANWKSYAPSLRKYADDLLRKGPRLPAGTTLARWYRDNEPSLKKSPSIRDRNKVAAYELLSVFESSPAGWEAVGYLNMGDPSASGGSFGRYLAEWRKRCPEKHRQFVGRIMELFGMNDSAGESGR